jgi:predicted dehydrogenase
MGVIGCGHLGRIHARLVAELDDVELVGVVDPHPGAREAVAAECKTQPLASHHGLLGSIDAAVVAAPTSLHHSITRKLIEAGVHVLVEKPLALTHQEADQLAHMARSHHVVLAAGHVERFNPAFVAVQQQVTQPLYIEATRTSGFTFRSLDVGAVLDLMIHDLELVLALVDSAIAHVSAVGAPVISAHEDFAEARVLFSNGCVAELKASRTSPVAARQMTIYEPDLHAFVDFGARRAQILRRSSALQAGSVQVERLQPAEIESLKPAVFQTLLPTTELAVAETNPLRDELLDFVTSIRLGRPPRVDGQQAARAVWLAEQIIAQVGFQKRHAA